MFINALPVWLKDREKELNLTLQFKTICPAAPNTQIHIATSGQYTLWINGTFVAYGPARAGKNHFRMDQLPISHLLTQEENTIVIECCAHNAHSF